MCWTIPSWTGHQVAPASRELACQRLSPQLFCHNNSELQWLNTDKACLCVMSLSLNLCQYSTKWYSHIWWHFFFLTTTPHCAVIERVPWRKIQCRDKKGDATRERICDVSWQPRQMEGRRAVGRPFTAAQPISHTPSANARTLSRNINQASSERIVFAMKRPFTRKAKLTFFNYTPLLCTATERQLASLTSKCVQH